MHSPITTALSRASAGAPGWSSYLGRLRYQLLFGFLLCVIGPGAIYHGGNFYAAMVDRSTVNTAVASGIAFLISLNLYRRVAIFPGFSQLAYLLSVIGSGYGLVLIFFFVSRLEYSRLNFGISFVLSILFLGAVVVLGRRIAQPFYIIPFGSSRGLTRIPDFDWRILDEPRVPDDPRTILIADLGAELEPAWERLIADAVLAGHPVYHYKQIAESITGRVEISHLSENSFGSLVPNLGYRKTKRAFDVLLALCLLPLFAIPALLVMALIKLDSPGPAFFRQHRRGYRGQVFEVIKFRTMTHCAEDADAHRDHSITRSSDSRITRVGKLLRRTRIDELPQIWNVLRGEMSWIGPRPEALPLSDWYMAELPYYTYRHIVRPGITGWAQVNQGHVAALEDVHDKLKYDFFYIKNFSAWLDLLILYRTIVTVISGFGAK